MMKAKIYVTLKKCVLDPQGKAVAGALNAMNYKEVEDVRVGKFIEVEIKGSSNKEQEARLKEMCDNLLANTVIENYRIEME
ncbi:MAG: phosphoribosylformylglycinamidine synthase subunit PurS [Deltaproteobacteria bacterium]|nr:phosphoribosylformylglycinamidine synthase subunit PurS [Deltaproteobacteria bacterium]